MGTRRKSAIPPTRNVWEKRSGEEGDASELVSAGSSIPRLLHRPEPAHPVFVVQPAELRVTVRSGAEARYAARRPQHHPDTDRREYRRAVACDGDERITRDPRPAAHAGWPLAQAPG